MQRDKHVAKIAQTIERDPFTTLARVREDLAADGVKLSTSSIWRAIRDAKLSRKRPRYRTSLRTANLEESEAFERLLAAQGSEKISIDETCVYSHERPRFGYAFKGRKLYFHTKKNPRSGKESLLIAMSDKRGIIAQCRTTGSFNTRSFTEFLQSIPAQRGTPVILDNVAFHHSVSAKTAAEAKGLVLHFTPPYSPDFNPVENAFSVFKSAMRRKDPVQMEIALKKITIEKCSEFFKGTLHFVRRHIQNLRATPVSREAGLAGGDADGDADADAARI